MNMQSELSRKEREKQLRRKEILAAAVEVFADKGFEHATLDEIAEAAEFGKGTIYNYFSSKEELFLTLLEEGQAALKEMLRERIEKCHNPLEKITAYVEVSFDFLQKREKHFRIIALEMHHPSSILGELHQRMRGRVEQETIFLAGLLEEAMQAGVVIPTQPRRLARALQALIHSQVCCMMEDPEHPFEGAAELVNRIFLEGVRIDGRKNSGRGRKSSKH